MTGVVMVGWNVVDNNLTFLVQRVPDDNCVVWRVCVGVGLGVWRLMHKVTHAQVTGEVVHAPS
jgi:hypothetical protein